MTPAEFDYLRDMLKQRSGLVLGEEKRYLLESRLMPVARKEGMESLSELVSALQKPDGESLRTKTTQTMTINESFFYRDKTPFENFRNITTPAGLPVSIARPSFSFQATSHLIGSIISHAFAWATIRLFLMVVN